MDGLNGRMRDAIRRTIEYLASVCDHASSLDDAGFSANTASIGHELAHLPDRYWNDGTFVAAARVAHHHRLQAITAAVLDEDVAEAMKTVADGPSTEDVRSGWMTQDQRRDGVVLSVSRDMADLVRSLKKLKGASQPAGRGRLWAIDAKHAFVLLPHLDRFDVHEGAGDVVAASMAAADPDLVMAASPRVVDAEDGMFTISFPYDGATVAEIKTLRRRRYDGKRWLVAPTAASCEAIERLCRDAGFIATSKASTLLQSAHDIPDQLEAAAPTAPSISSAMFGNRLILLFRYDPHLVEAIKTLPPDQRSYNRERRSWSVAPQAIPELVAALEGMTTPPDGESMDGIRRWMIGGAPAPA